MPLIRFTSPEPATSPPWGEAFSYAAAGTCSSHGRNDIWDGGPNVQLLKSPAESELPLDHIIQIAADQFSHTIRCQLREHRELKALLNDLHLSPRAPLPPQPFAGHGTDTKQRVSQPPPLSVKNASDQAFPRPLKSATSCGWCSSEAGDTRITKSHGPQGEQDSEAHPSLDLSDSAASCLKLRPNNTAAPVPSARRPLLQDKTSYHLGWWSFLVILLRWCSFVSRLLRTLCRPSRHQPLRLKRRLKRRYLRQHKLRALRRRVTARRLYCQKASLASRPALRMPKFADSMANSVCSAAPDTSCNTPACTTTFHSSAIAADSTATVSRTYGLSPGVIEVADGSWRDWQCPCGYLNFERRTNCLHCSKPRLRPVQSPSAGSQCYLQ